MHCLEDFDELFRERPEDKEDAFPILNTPLPSISSTWENGPWSSGLDGEDQVSDVISPSLYPLFLPSPFPNVFSI